MEIYCNKEDAQLMIEAAKSFNVNAQVIGMVESSATKMLTIKSEHGVFEY
jgi:phosphoribosylformylglycinamidine cyclo-ligase